MKTGITLTKCKRMAYLALAALTLACSDNDQIDKGNGNGKKSNYIGVHMTQPKSISTRAAGSGFEYGTDDENAASTGLFFLFDSVGNLYGTSQAALLTPKEDGTSTTPEVEKTYNAVLVIDGIEEKPSDDLQLQIVCVLNPPVGSGLESTTTLDELTGKIGDYDAHGSGSFIMTNSVYKEKDGSMVLGTVIKGSDVFDTADEALAKPVNIYVERVVAKVRMKPKGEGEEGFKNDGAKVTVNNEEKELTIKITGIEIANIAEKSYLFKHIDETWNDSTWIWDETNKRCYWETVPTDMTYGNKSYNDIAQDGFNINDLDSTAYIQPNTSDQKTAVLVTAELLDDDEPFDFVYLRGSYFTPEGALTLIAEYAANNGNGYCKKEGDTYSKLKPEDFEWENKEDNPDLTWLESYEVVAKVKSDVENLYKKNGEEYEETSADEINKLLAGTEKEHPYVARFYKDGKCYYFVNIDQTPVAIENGYEGEGKFEGVVRNHIYDLTLNSITGIGTPVFDPEDVIIPEKPEDEDLYFLSATVSVLAWKLVEQKVEFE